MEGNKNWLDTDDKVFHKVVFTCWWILSILTILCHRDREAWRTAVDGVAKSRTWLSNWTELRNPYAGQEAIVRTGHGTTDWFQLRKGVCQTCLLSPCLFNLYAEYIHHEKRWAGSSPSWNQDCWGKYQWPQICRWHHTNGRKERRTKEALDESERGEWKSWLKAPHSEN